MENIPVIKLGLVAVSRDCFPIALSEKRRANIAAKLAKKKVNFVVFRDSSKRRNFVWRVAFRAPSIFAYFAIGEFANQ